MPGPHGFAVRFNIGRLRAVRSLTGLAQSKTRPAITHAPDAAASTASRPASMTMANAPLWDGTARDIDLIWVCGEAEYFCRRGWTRSPTNGLTGKSVKQICLRLHAAFLRSSASARYDS